MTTGCQGQNESYDYLFDKPGVSYDLAATGGYTSPVPTTGERIRKERDARHWSLEDLARESGVDRVTLNRIELGKQRPHKSTLKAIDRALHTPRPKEPSDEQSIGDTRGGAGLEDRLADLIAYIKTLDGKQRSDFIRASIALLSALEHAGPRAATGTAPDDAR